MNFVFISPNFPENYWMFCRGLKRHGATVLAIVDCPYDSLRRELREYIDDCYVVSSMENYDEMVRAMGYFTYRYGKIDWVESNNEYWLSLDARLRQDFHITTGITIDQEIARVDEVVARANEKGIPVIAVMLEKDKRSDVKTNSNERCIDAVCPHASWMIVTADVNTDGRYDAFKAENGTPLTILDSSMDFISLVQQAFVKE